MKSHIQFFRHFTILIVLVAFSSGCASAPRKRFMIGAGIGGAAGGISGAVFSPNDESRGLNALVFGLVGAVVGGLIGLFIHDDSEVPEAKPKEQTTDATATRELEIVPTQKELPQFVKDRLKQIVIEEIHEPDQVSEDGTLHEPHKAYRIKRPAELIAKPIKQATSKAK